MPEVQRQNHYIKSGSETIFGWLHSVANGKSNDFAAVICGPLGVEYMSGHRSLRRLADRLSICGIPALRFDYSCTGNSTGGHFRNTNVTQIVTDIQSATTAARSITGASRVVLIGVGLGATFAAIAMDGDDVGQLVLWNPTSNGRRFVREQRLLSEVLDENGTSVPGAIDSAGIFLTSEFQEQMNEIDLTRLSWNRSNPVLLISRSDMDSHRKLAKVLSEKNFPFEHTTLPGYKEMMDQPTDTVVPVAAIEFICGWLEGSKATVSTFNQATDTSANEPTLSSNRVLIPADDIADIELEEIPATFGANDQLFGIATMSRVNADTSPVNRAFVFLNCGSEHHSGPHRLYTIICRHIASRGGLTFRFDIEGIGDSVSIGNNEENNAYSPVALDDIDQALTYLTEKYGCDEFIVSGICAGAYHSFKAAAELKHHNIKEANLVNPLVFEWNYDDPEDHLKYEVHTYKSAIRNRGSWRRLFSGDINYRRLTRSVIKHFAENVRRQMYRIWQALLRRAPKGLPTDLKNLRELHRPLTLILSEGDPGLNIMKLQGGWETSAAIRDGRIKIYSLESANHGLSKKYMQDQLVSAIVGKYYGDD